MDENKPFELPTFNGITIDKRLRQFRKISSDMGIEFIEFDSDKGQDLLEEMSEYFSFLFAKI